MRAFSSSRASTRRPRIRSAVLVAATTGSAPSPVAGRSAAARAARWWRDTPARRCRSCSGAVKLRWRIWFRAWILAERADRLATTSARIASTFPSRDLAAPQARPDSAARAASTASSGPGLAGPSAGLAAGAVHLNHLHPRRPQEPGQARAIGSGALHPGPGHRPEPRQPAQQLTVPGRGGGKLRHRQ
jgi:hypothetical protein